MSPCTHDPPLAHADSSKCDFKVANLGRRQVNYVIESCKYHQHQDNRETNAKPYFLGPFRQRTATDGFE